MAELKLLKNKNAPYCMFTLERGIYYVEPPSLAAYVKVATDLQKHRKYFDSNIRIEKGMNAITFTSTEEEIQQWMQKLVEVEKWNPNAPWNEEDNG